jgi:hypothetical protein
MELLTYVGCIIIAPGRFSRPNEMYDAATALLVDTGTRKLVVTCEHVIREYEAQRAKDPSMILALNLGDGDKTIELPDPTGPKRLIASDVSRDLAVLDYRGLDSNEISNRRYLPIDLNAIERPSIGDAVLFIGFPKAFRKTDETFATLCAIPVPLVVSQIAHSTILCACEGCNREAFADLGERFGGFSGGPVFAVDSNGKLHLVGFVREKASFGLMLTPADCLREMLASI